MSNKRILKRNINEMVFDVVEECFHHQMLDESKAPATEKLITEAATFQDVILGRMHKAKGKTEFRAIVAEVEAKALTFVDALNALNK
jgi:hypothetical protein